jgi:hypothetical protein
MVKCIIESINFLLPWKGKGKIFQGLQPIQIAHQHLNDIKEIIFIILLIHNSSLFSELIIFSLNSSKRFV